MGVASRRWGRGCSEPVRMWGGMVLELGHSCSGCLLCSWGWRLSQLDWGGPGCPGRGEQLPAAVLETAGVIPTPSLQLVALLSPALTPDGQQQC